MKKSQIEKSWQKILKLFLNSQDWEKLSKFVATQYKEKTIYPEEKNIFKAFSLVPFNKVKVVILGQDPYHTPDIAEGLCFSVPKGQKVPPSIKNIYKEMYTDLGIKKDFQKAELYYLAKQGILLLNRVMTVEAHKAGSHWKKGWEGFSDFVISEISRQKDGVVFVLWGKNAQEVEHLIDKQKHLILKSPHPSPFSAHTGFFGSKPFSKTNNYLRIQGKKEIKW